MDIAETPGLSESPVEWRGRKTTVGIFLSDQLSNFFARNSGFVHV